MGKVEIGKAEKNKAEMGKTEMSRLDMNQKETGHLCGEGDREEGRTEHRAEDRTGRCIVIGAGDLTLGDIGVAEEDFVIAVDGGLGYCGLLEVEPDIIMGDFDSVSEQEAAAVRELEIRIPDRVIRFPREKDDTDLLAALKEGLSRGYRDFRIYAATGGRLDHTLANIQCLLYLKRHGAAGYLIDGTGMILVIVNETVHFQRSLEGTLSLFSLEKETRGVTLRNMKYPLEDAVITNDYPVGISNEFTGKEAEIIVEDGALVCMISYAQ